MNIPPASRSNGNAALNGVASGYLDFEKPLARIEREIGELESGHADSKRDLSTQIREMRTQLSAMTKRIYAHLTPWETVLVARHPRRPILPHYISMIVKDFTELHGDRTFGDDHALVTGFGRIGGEKVMLIGHNKGRDTKEKIRCNFGCAHPEGYRKALLKMRLAAKYRLPIVCLIDTQGAYPGIGAEERGIAQAIAFNLMEIPQLKTPIVCVIIGEGGSGGALGIGIGDRVAMFEYSFYSVISPEGCAAILWRSGEQAKLAAEALRITAKELKKLGIVDDIIPEPIGGAHRDPAKAANTLERYIGKTIRELKSVRPQTLLEKRYARLREMGSYFDSQKPAAKPPAARKTPSPPADRTATRSARTPAKPTSRSTPKPP